MGERWRTGARCGLAALVALALGAGVMAPTATAAAVSTPAEPPGPVAGWSTTEGTDGRVYIADGQG
jgi:hypothetical protein